MQIMFENDRINQSGQSLITDCQPCWRQTKGLIAAVAMIALTGCQPATIPSSSIPATTKTALLSQIQQASPVPKSPVPKPGLAESSDQARSAINRTASARSSPDSPSDVKKTWSGQYNRSCRGKCDHGFDHLAVPNR
jgi:hypothetical protein